MSTARPSLANFHAQQVAPEAPAKRAKKATEELIQTSFRLPRARWQRLQELSIH